MLTPPQTPEDIKAKKQAKKEKKAAKLAAKAEGNGRPSKNKKGVPAQPEPVQFTPVSEPVESAPQPTGSEAAPAAGEMSQRAPRATVEEADDE
jgi:translocation protein SEC62